MFKRRTTKARHRKQAIQLQAKVMSPRIVWFGFLNACGKLAKLSLVLAVIGAAGWGVWLGVRRCLFDNEEFRLQAIQMTPNAAMDLQRLVSVAHIDIRGSLFDCDPEEIEKNILSLPEIYFASVKREFPGTLVVKVLAREPVAWVACEDQPDPVLPRDPRNGLVVDSSGFAYRCPAAQLEQALTLPVIVLSSTAAGSQPLQAGHQVVNPEYDRCMTLRAVAFEASPDAGDWIDSIRQSREWALEMTSRDGMKATFGLGDHSRQMQDLMAAVSHSQSGGQPISSINLIPRNHIPVVLMPDGEIPRAIPVAEPEPPKGSARQRDSDLQKLINRR